MIKWEKLPEEMQCDEVKYYYDILKKKRISMGLKRIFDILLSGIMLVVLTPLFVVCGIWIKCDSPGPVMFRQERITTYGKVFRIFKFRTMVDHAEKLGTQVTTQGDSRITKVGAKIRKCRLDEIPQLINIFLGDMSFVGTRPEVKKYVDCYSKEMMATLLLPAGVTSRASIEYKDEDQLLVNAQDADKVYVETILPEKMKYNLSAIENFSLINDVKIMFETILAVIR